MVDYHQKYAKKIQKLFAYTHDNGGHHQGYVNAILTSVDYYQAAQCVAFDVTVITPYILPVYETCRHVASFSAQSQSNLSENSAKCMRRLLIFPLLVVYEMRIKLFSSLWNCGDDFVEFRTSKGKILIGLICYPSVYLFDVTLYLETASEYGVEIPIKYLSLQSLESVNIYLKVNIKTDMAVYVYISTFSRESNFSE